MFQDWFGFISRPMELGLIWLAHTVGSAGIGIILFTIFVRLILSPLQITQLRNAKKMQRLQPLMAELKQKHGKDREALTAATMALYKEHNANPAMGCLPTLLQFPILIGLFYALLHLGQSPTLVHHVFKAGVGASVCGANHPATFAQWLSQCYAVTHSPVSASKVYSLYHSVFLWLSDGLGQPDPLKILPFLAGATQWIQSRMMLTKSNDQQQQMMNSMMNFMPLIIIVFAMRYASGLSLYWVTSTVIGIAIQARITGWGLLPRPSTILRGGIGIRQPARALTNGTGRRPRPQKQEAQESRPNSRGKERLEAAGAPRPGKELPEGQNGEAVAVAGEERPPAAGARSVRKRANRAKGGGRTGGRRG